MLLWLQTFAANSLRCLAGFLFCCQVSLASEAVDLFTVTVDVESESIQERAVASRAALKTLFVRVTGDALAIEAYPLLAASMTKANRYIASFSYQKHNVTPSANTANPFATAVEGDLDIALALAAPDIELDNLNDVSKLPEVLRLNLVFQADAIKDLLLKAGAPYWQANRPGVLVWLVEQRGSQRVMMNAENAPQFYQALNRGAQMRGIPLIQPLLDLEEASLINANDIWNASLSIIQEASKRYDNGAVLVGKLSQAYDKSWLGQWTLLYRGERKIEHYRGSDLNDYFIRGSNLVADRLALDYAVTASQQQLSNSLTFKFSGVRAHADYVELSEYLRQIPALKAIQLSHINGEHCYFSLSGSHDIDKIRALIELNKRIVSANDGSRAALPMTKLQFRWLGKR